MSSRSFCNRVRFTIYDLRLRRVTARNVAFRCYEEEYLCWMIPKLRKAPLRNCGNISTDQQFSSTKHGLSCCYRWATVLRYLTLRFPQNWHITCAKHRQTPYRFPQPIACGSPKTTQCNLLSLNPMPLGQGHFFCLGFPAGLGLQVAGLGLGFDTSRVDRQPGVASSCLPQRPQAFSDKHSVNLLPSRAW